MGGFGIGTVTKAISAGLHDVADEAARAMENAGHAEAGLARTLVAKARQIGNRLPGGMHLGDRGFGAGPHRTTLIPKLAHDPVAPHPGDFPILTTMGDTYCGQLPGGGQPFPLVGYKLLAAGAQTQGTDLFDFHAATSNPTIIVSNDLIPGNVEVFEASLYIGVKMLTTLGSENAAFLNSMWVVERVNGIEKARWTLKQLAEMVSHTGLTTSGACAATEKIDLASIPWHRKYDPNIPHALAVQCSVTTTTIQALEFTFTEVGKRP